MEDREQQTGEMGTPDPHATQHGGTRDTTETATTDGPGEEGDEFDAGCLDANDSFDEHDHMETSPMHKDGSVYDEPPATDIDKKGDSGVLNLEEAGKISGSEKISTKPPPIPARIHFSDGGKIHSGTVDMSTQQAGSFKHQYYVIKAMKARQCAPAALGGGWGVLQGAKWRGGRRATLGLIWRGMAGNSGRNTSMTWLMAKMSPSVSNSMGSTVSLVNQHTASGGGLTVGSRLLFFCQTRAFPPSCLPATATVRSLSGWRGGDF
jgi:hypothetical protein